MIHLGTGGARKSTASELGEGIGRGIAEAQARVAPPVAAPPALAPPAPPAPPARLSTGGSEDAAADKTYSREVVDALEALRGDNAVLAFAKVAGELYKDAPAPALNRFMRESRREGTSPFDAATRLTKIVGFLF